MMDFSAVKEIAGKMKQAANGYARTGDKTAAAEHSELHSKLMLEIEAAAFKGESVKKEEIEAKGQRLVEVKKEAEDIQAQNLELAEQIAKLEGEIKTLQRQRSANNANYHNVQKTKNALEHFAKSHKLDYGNPETWSPLLRQAANEAREQAKALSQ